MVYLINSWSTKALIFIQQMFFEKWSENYVIMKTSRLNPMQLEMLKILMVAIAAIDFNNKVSPFYNKRSFDSLSHSVVKNYPRLISIE